VTEFMTSWKSKKLLHKYTFKDGLGMELQLAMAS